MTLSQSLPLQAERFQDQQCHPFFSGLLPEGQLRRLIAQQCAVSGDNDFALLEAIGGDCAGAVSLWPEGGEALGSNPAGVDWLEPQQLVTLLEELPRRPMLAGADGLRLSLAGAQDKLPVIVDGERIGLPRGHQPSTHILKPAIAAVDDSVHNEAFCMALLKSMGMRAADTRILMVEEQAILLVSRYDRCESGDGRWVRLHQEDFCQALGVMPELKYQNEGGPDLAACFALIRRSTRPSAPQVLQLLDAAIVNAMLGNHDAHAKNFSLLYTDKATVLPPLYDVLCTAVYPALTPKMAMKVGSNYKFSELHRRHWEQFAEAAGLSKAQAKKRVLQITKKLSAKAHQVRASEGFCRRPIIDKIVKLIDERAALTHKRLAGS